MEKTKTGLFERLKAGLQKTNKSINDSLVQMTTRRIKIDEPMLEELEESLISADLGMPTVINLIESLKTAARNKEVTTMDGVRPFLRKRIKELVTVNSELTQTPATPTVILMIGVNGAGKTTTIGKLANMFKKDGKSLIIAAGDTFRAAAIDQLAEWSKRVGCDLVRHHPNSDPSAVVFDAMKAFIARKKDILIIDTAGRLHTRANLMEQLKKVHRIIKREMDSAPHEILLVLDGASGQNCLNQVREFNKAMPVTGLVLTKLDGTAKGGAVIGLIHETGIPVKYLGIGEGIEDLQPFDPELFASAVL